MNTKFTLTRYNIRRKEIWPDWIKSINGHNAFYLVWYGDGNAAIKASLGQTLVLREDGSVGVEGTGGAG